MVFGKASVKGEGCALLPEPESLLGSWLKVNLLYIKHIVVEARASNYISTFLLGVVFLSPGNLVLKLGKSLRFPGAKGPMFHLS